MTTPSPKQKLYCYVDETGLDPRSEFFIVSVVVAGSERDVLIKELEHIEHMSGKGWRKWVRTRPTQQVAYMRQILHNPQFKNKLHYAVYPQTTEYLSKTVLTVARAITVRATSDRYRATVFIDGLPKSLVPETGTALRHLHMKIFKIRGVRKEEADPLMRLADALCGFIRAAREGNKEFRTMLESAIAHSFIREL